MSDKRAFEALTLSQIIEQMRRLAGNRVGDDRYIVSCKELGDWIESLAAYDAWREGQYLAEGMRFKLAATRSGAAAEFRSFPAELAGKWVALVDATDDKHLRTHPAPKAAADWVCVPREPTEAMQVAGRKKLAEVCDRFDEARNTARSSIEFWQIVGHHPADDIWSTMLAASPARGGEGER